MIAILKNVDILLNPVIIENSFVTPPVLKEEAKKVLKSFF